MINRTLNWQTMQRTLAEALVARPEGYPAGGGAPQPAWRFDAGSGSWLNRSRNGVRDSSAGVPRVRCAA